MAQAATPRRRHFTPQADNVERAHIYRDAGRADSISQGNERYARQRAPPRRPMGRRRRRP